MATQNLFRGGAVLKAELGAVNDPKFFLPLDLEHPVHAHKPSVSDASCVSRPVAGTKHEVFPFSREFPRHRGATKRTKTPKSCLFESLDHTFHPRRHAWVWNMKRSSLSSRDNTFFFLLSFARACVEKKEINMK